MAFVRDISSMQLQSPNVCTHVSRNCCWFWFTMISSKCRFVRIRNVSNQLYNFRFFFRNQFLVCKSCLVKHLEENNTCPACEMVIHQSHPLQYISFDRTMQDIVYKLVPNLQEGMCILYHLHVLMSSSTT